MAHDTYQGLAANISAPPSAVSIASSTNTTPIVLTTSTAHQINTGDYVSVDRHLLNIGANGIWQVGTVTSTTLVLLGTTGGAIGANTGTVQSFDLGTTDMVTDGNPPFAAEWSVPDACGLDRASFLWIAHLMGFGLAAASIADQAATAIGFSVPVMTVPNVSQATTLTLPSTTIVAPFAGRRVRLRFRRMLSASAFDCIIVSGADTILTLPGSAAGSSWGDVDIISTAWRTTAWGGSAIAASL